MKHNWTKDTMDECRKVFLDQLIATHYNYGDTKKIEKLIEQFAAIESDIGRKAYDEKDRYRLVCPNSACRHWWYGNPKDGVWCPTCGSGHSTMEDYEDRTH
jgi:hypothetical protein